MEYYYGQPLVHCYLLHAEWLAERAGVDDDELASALYLKLMNDTLGAGKFAQKHLSDLLNLDRPANDDPAPGDGKAVSA
jgi:hypothetical protein